jgi:ribulose-5-phosphate 4-epimerase/fuculose-1-phosphate aldolase
LRPIGGSTAARGGVDPLLTEIEITLAHVIMYACSAGKCTIALFKGIPTTSAVSQWLVLMTDGYTAAAAVTVVAGAEVHVLWSFHGLFVYCTTIRELYEAIISSSSRAQ